jgi:hypothetical protein
MAVLLGAVAAGVLAAVVTSLALVSRPTQVGSFEVRADSPRLEVTTTTVFSTTFEPLPSEPLGATDPSVPPAVDVTTTTVPPPRTVTTGRSSSPTAAPVVTPTTAAVRPTTTSPSHGRDTNPHGRDD